MLRLEPNLGNEVLSLASRGLPQFREEADRLADTYGERFRPNKLLRDMAAKGETFYERFGAKQKAAA